MLQDVLVAIRCRTSLDGCEQERRGNRESVLRSPVEMVERFSGIDPAAVARTAAVAERLEFDLTQELGYRYPDFADTGEPAIRRLAAICGGAFAERYAPCDDQLQARARARLEEELRLIDELGLAGFFLLHWEVLELARACALEVRGPGSPRRFLPPGRGRGSSVGSIVCYLTGLSHVDPVANELSLGRFLNRELSSVPDIDLDFPRDIRERLIVAVTERYGQRARGARRDLRDVSLAWRDPRRGQGARPAARRARAARPRHRRLERRACCRRGRRPPGCREQAAVAPLARLLVPHRRDRRPAPARLAAPGRDGHLDPSARRARARAAGGDGGQAAVPVGQGLVRRRGLPQDRPARPGHALGGRGLRRADRAGVRRADRSLPHPPRRPGGVRRDPAGRHGRHVPDREPRADAEPAADEAGDDRRPHRPGGAGAARADPGEGGAPVHRGPQATAGGPLLRAAGRPRAAARAAARHARRRRLPGSGARRGDRARRLHGRRGRGAAARDEPQAQPGGARGVPGTVPRGRGAKGRGRGDRRPRLRQARRLLGLRLPEVARGRLRPARLPVAVAAPPLPGRVPRRAAQRAADGLLPAGEPRPRRAAARGGGALARREREPRPLLARAGSRRADGRRPRRLRWRTG